MKRSILMLLGLSAALIFFGCEKETIPAPGSDQNIQEESALKGAKAGNTFEGLCTFVEPVPNTWYDDMDDWRVTGTTIWVQPDPNVFEGTAELIVDDGGGRWEMTWAGSLTPTTDGLTLVASAEGKGVEGKVKGMKANWTYTMNYIGSDFPNPANETFFYDVEGVIKKTGHLKQWKRQQ